MKSQTKKVRCSDLRDSSERLDNGGAPGSLTWKCFGGSLSLSTNSGFQHWTYEWKMIQCWLLGVSGGVY